MKLSDVVNLRPRELDDLANMVVGGDRYAYTYSYDHGVHAIERMSEKSKPDDREVLRFSITTFGSFCHVELIHYSERRDFELWSPTVIWETFGRDWALELARGIVALGIARGQL